MDIICPHCRQTLEGDGSLVGADVMCPSCNRAFTVPKLVAGNSFPVEIQRMRFAKKRNALKWLAIGIPIVTLLLLGGVFVCRSSRDEKERQDFSAEPDGSAAVATQNRVRNPTKAEKLAMGRVIYHYAKVKVLMSQLSSSGNDESGAAGAQLLAGLGDAVMPTEIDTTGCPEDFAKAWKDFAASVAALKIVEGGYNFMSLAVGLARQQGRYVDAENRMQLSEMEAKLQELSRDCIEKTGAFFAVCQRYGEENLHRWAMEACRRGEDAGDVDPWTELEPLPEDIPDPLDLDELDKHHFARPLNISF